MALPVRTLGTGLHCSSIGLGCMSLTAGFNGKGPSEDEAIEVLRRAYDLGITLFNTSDLYGINGSNEVLLGKALNDVKDKVVFATKWGPHFKDGKIVSDYSPEYCRKACEGALERLGVGSIGLFTLRGPLPAGHDIAATMGEVKKLVDEGKVQHVGLSEVSAEHIRAAHAIVPITATEQEWSLFSRDIETDLLPTCRELGIGVLAYSPLGRGLLAGLDISTLDATDYRLNHAPRFAGDNLQQNLKLAKAVDELAAKKGCTTSQIALAWLLTKGEDVVPIPGTKRIDRVEENVAAASVKLSPEEVAELENAVPQHAVAGGRYASDALTYKGSGAH